MTDYADFTGWTTPEASQKLTLASKMESKGMDREKVNKQIDKAEQLEREGK